MELQEFWTRKRKLEADIAGSVSSLLRAFEEETGASPCSVSVDLVETSSFSDPNRRFVVGSVFTEIKGLA